MWDRASDIVCQPHIRIAFVCMVLIASIVGARPKALVKFPYERICFALVRDPRNRSRVTLAATISVPTVKLKAKRRQRPKNEQ